MAEQTWAIRRATGDDAPAILDCLRSAFAPYRDAYTPEAFADTVLSSGTIEDRLREMTVFVAGRSGPDGGIDGPLVGTIGGHAAAGGDGHIRGMAVRPDCEGGGAGRALLEVVERHLAASGCSRITLDTTRPLTRAIAFYEGHGYRPTGIVRDFYGMDLLEYVKTL